MITSPKDNALKLSNYLNQMVGEIQTPQQLQATKQYLMNLTNNDPEIKANNLQFVPLGVANSLVNHPMNQPVQGTTKDKIESQLMASNTQPPGIQNIPQHGLNAPPQPPQVGNLGVASLPQAGGIKMARGGAIRMADGGSSFDAVLKQFLGNVGNAKFEAPTDPRLIEKQVAAERPDFAEALNKPAGQGLSNILDQIAKEREAQYAQQTGQDVKEAQRERISNMLAQMAEGTRGTGNNLAGLMSGVLAGTTYSNRAIAEERERLNALKTKNMEAKLSDAKLRDLIEERRLAAANGEVAKVIAYDKAIKDLQNEKTKLGITSLGTALSPLASIEHARISAAAQSGAYDKPTDFIKDATALMKYNPKLSFEEAYKMAGRNRGAGAEISSLQRDRKELFDKIAALQAQAAPLLLNTPANSPFRKTIEDNLKAETDKLVNQFQSLYPDVGGAPRMQAPDVNQPTPGFGTATLVK